MKLRDVARGMEILSRLSPDREPFASYDGDIVVPVFAVDTPPEVAEELRRLGWREDDEEGGGRWSIPPH